MDVVGGAFDGVTIETTRRPPWGWIGEYGADHRVYARPGASRELYRLAEPSLGSEPVYVTAEHTHAVCGACGVLSEASADCRLCGGALTRT